MAFFESYKNAYLNSGEGIWEDSTIFLYIFVVVLACVFANKAQSMKSISLKNSKVYFVFIGIILVLLSGLRGEKVGADTLQYRVMWEYSRNSSYDFGSTEPMFLYINRAFSSIVPDGRFGVFFFSFITIFFVLSSIYNYKERINFFLAISAFVCIFFLQSLNLIRIYLAASFLLYCFRFLIEQENIKKYALCICIASLIHTSSLVLLFPLALLILYRYNKIIAGIAFIAIFAFCFSLKDLLFQYITVERYLSYMDSNESGRIGLLGYVELAPVIFVVIYIFKKRLKGFLYDVIVTFSSAAFLIRLLAYFIIPFGRLSIHFIALYVLLIPIFITRIGHFSKKVFVKRLSLIYLLYLSMRLHLYFSTMIGPDELMPYTVCFSE